MIPSLNTTGAARSEGWARRLPVEGENATPDRANHTNPSRLDRTQHTENSVQALLVSDLGVIQATAEQTVDADDFFNESFTMLLLTAEEAEWLHKQQYMAQEERKGLLGGAWIAEQEELKSQVQSWRPALSSCTRCSASTRPRTSTRATRCCERVVLLRFTVAPHTPLFPVGRVRPC